MAKRPADEARPADGAGPVDEIPPGALERDALTPDEGGQPDELRGEGTPTVGGDLVGPGTGGIPTAAGTGEEPTGDAERDPDVAAVVDALRSDEPDPDRLEQEVQREVDDAAEQAGSGTDR